MSGVGKSEDLTLAQAAARFDKSARWLQTLLAEDLRKPEADRRLQFHDYIGRSPVWTETQFQALRVAIKAHSAARKAAEGRPVLKSSSGTATGTYTGRCGSREDQSALDALLALRPGKTLSPSPKPSGTGSKARSATKPSSAGNSPSPSPMLRIVT
jgi:hypothetical protein